MFVPHWYNFRSKSITGSNQAPQEAVLIRMIGTHSEGPCDKPTLCRYLGGAAIKLLFRELRDAQATIEVSETETVNDPKNGRRARRHSGCVERGRFVCGQKDGDWNFLARTTTAADRQKRDPSASLAPRTHWTLLCHHCYTALQFLATTYRSTRLHVDKFIWALIIR